MTHFDVRADSGLYRAEPQAGTLDDCMHVEVNQLKFYGIIRRVFYSVRAFFYECFFMSITLIIRIKEKLFGAPIEYVDPAAPQEWREQSKGLYVLIHGLEQRPTYWRAQLNLLRKEQIEFDLRAPYVPKNGNCSLDAASDPIEKMIRDYIKKNPGKPVCLMGASNGGRIAAKLEVSLRNTGAPIRVSSVAGALFGTKRVDALTWIWPARRFISSGILNELVYESSTAIQLVKRMCEETDEKRSYDFYATPNDALIKPYGASFPILQGKEVNYYLAPGEGHNSLMQRVARHQVDRCSAWMGAVQLV